MRFVVAVMSFLLAAACTASYMKQYVGTTEAGPEAAFDCVLNVVTELRYEIKEADQSSGVIRAKSQKPTLNKYDASALISELAITLTQDPDSDGVTISVTSNNPGHANTILAACTPQEPADPEQ